MKSSDVPYYFAVTATTRRKRPYEVHGVDYLFVGRGEFLSMVRNDELLEWAEVYGNHYGVPKHQVRTALAHGQDVILKVDVQGADNIRRIVPNAVYIFLAPPNMPELKRRLLRRRTESRAGLSIRLLTALSEMEEADKFENIVVNRTNRLDETVRKINRIIRNERLRPGRRSIVI